MNNGMMIETANSDEWETPEWLFRALDTEFGFSLDPCATKENARCTDFLTKDMKPHGLDATWGTQNKAFINPPYSQIGLWLEKAIIERCILSVMLLPVRTDNSWFQLLTRCADIRFYRKRIKFLENGVEMGSPRFPSMLAIIRPF